MAKIYWRDGIAYARASVKGVEKRQSLETRSRAEAQSRFEQWLAEIGAERNARWVQRETPFAEAVTLFNDEHLPTLKKSTQARYLLSQMALLDHFEGTHLQRITKVELSKFMGARRKKELSDSTIRRDLSCLSSVFTIASDHGLCEANPVLQFLREKKKTKQLVEADARTRYLYHDEELLILTRARENADAKPYGSPRWHEKFMILCAIALYIDTGLRAQELLNAKWSWISLDRHEIKVPKEVSKNGKARTVPLLPRALKILGQLPRHETAPWMLWRCSTGKSFADLNKTLQKIAASVGVTDITIHDLRRTCGCRLLQDWKMSMERVSRWLGHGSVVITESRYAFLNIEDLHDALGVRHRSQDTKLQVGSFFGAPEERTLAGTPNF